VAEHLNRSFQIKLYNESDPAVFVNWRLIGLDVVESLTANSRSDVVLFKPIVETYRARELLDQFADGKVLFVFRHYNDVITSSVRFYGDKTIRRRAEKWRKSGFSVFLRALPEPVKGDMLELANARQSAYDDAAIHWILYNSFAFTLGLCSDSRVLLVNYERLVQEPREAFQRLSRSSGVKFSPRMLEGVFATSVRKPAPPRLSAGIGAECERIWGKMQKAYDRQLSIGDSG